MDKSSMLTMLYRSSTNTSRDTRIRWGASKQQTVYYESRYSVDHLVANDQLLISDPLFIRRSFEVKQTLRTCKLYPTIRKMSAIWLADSQERLLKIFFKRPFIIISFSSRHRLQFCFPYLLAGFCFTKAHVFENYRFLFFRFQTCFDNFVWCLYFSLRRDLFSKCHVI